MVTNAVLWYGTASLQKPSNILVNGNCDLSPQTLLASAMSFDGITSHATGAVSESKPLFKQKKKHVLQTF